MHSKLRRFTSIFQLLERRFFRSNMSTELKQLSGLLLLLQLSASVITTEASPLVRVHVKFSQPPHQIQDHGITTDGGKLVSQQSYLSFGQRIVPTIKSQQSRNTYYNPINPAQFRDATPTAAAHRLPFYQPAELVANDISYGGHESGQTTPDFSNGLDYPDPQLRVGADAMLTVKYIYGRGEMFFHEIPHARLLLRNNQKRRENHLNGHALASLRPGSAWLRKN